MAKLCQFKSNCQKAGITSCEGCNIRYCLDHLVEHRNMLHNDFQRVLSDRDLLRQEFYPSDIGNANDNNKELLHRINQWEMQMIQMVSNAAENGRQQIRQLLNENHQKLCSVYDQLSDELRQRFKNDDYYEQDIKNLAERLEQLKLALTTPSAIQLQLENIIDLHNSIRIITSNPTVSKNVQSNDCGLRDPNKNLQEDRNKTQSFLHKSEMLLNRLQQFEDKKNVLEQTSSTYGNDREKCKNVQVMTCTPTEHYNLLCSRCNVVCDEKCITFQSYCALTFGKCTMCPGRCSFKHHYHDRKSIQFRTVRLDERLDSSSISSEGCHTSRDETEEDERTLVVQQLKNNTMKSNKIIKN
ncbi:unnamed protein product [Didymodactylos carnosus]|uniref:Uncharacterized protein n=1 Tax=Didymodactylos carnosus TaxID=1234261 RepID=A0A815IYN8_9BILA|nr:unnamed protein product [Didymodactylos carnosus]CAF1371069.1 unnamed protein product [Didymodactylos carnosus]CAF4063506.1 unnamed protein product [Didymodactylos carnosus]CAF4257485.1 unnamed protein product [Didymodactylos carnosus]